MNYQEFARFVYLLLFVTLAGYGHPLLVHAQEKNQLHVCVVDAANQAGIMSARVNLTSDTGNFSRITDANGCAHFTGVLSGQAEDHDQRPSALSIRSAYPNPTLGIVRIRVQNQGADPCEFSLFDVTGRALSVSHRWYRIQDGFEIEADVRDLPDGLYLYRVNNETASAHGTFVKSIAGYAGPTLSGLIDNAASERAEATPQISSNEVPIRIEVVHEEFVDYVEDLVVSHGDLVAVPLKQFSDRRIPLIDLSESLYLGEFEGGLYPGVSNDAPEPHLAEGIRRANQIQPLDTQGRPDPDGKIVFTSIGMSTTSSVFCGVADSSEPCKQGTFMDVVRFDTDFDHDHLVFIDGADPGKVADKWLTPGEKTYDRIVEEELTPLGLTEAQVQVAWVNLASTQPDVSLPDPGADAITLKRQYGDVMRALQVRYPNMKIVLFSSRVYGGYANSEINPEPYAFESGFAVKWLIEAQLEQMYREGSPVDQDTGDLNYNTTVPWIAWGPYVWADGRNPRSDGLVWNVEDLKEDGTHLTRLGVEKYSAYLLDFLKTAPFTRCWAVTNGVCE